MYSQEYFESTEVVKDKIKIADLEENPSGKKIFNILAIANNRNSKDIQLSPKSRIFLKAYRNDNNNMECSVSISYTDISGDINFKDFMIDSVLYPSAIKAELEIYNGRTIIDTRSYSFGTNCKANIIDLSDFNNNRGELRIEIKNRVYTYSQKDLGSVENLIALLKKYYSTSTLLDMVNSRYIQYAMSANESAEDIFVHKVETDQVNHGLSEMGYFNSLNIHLRDPDNLKQKIEEFRRYLNRSETLFMDLVTENSPPSSDWREFCMNTVSMFNDYLVKSESLQPSDAISFIEVSEITDNPEMENLFLTIRNYYTGNNIEKSNLLGYCLTDAFIKNSIAWEKEQYLDKSLTMLRNTNLLSQWFDIPLNSDYYKLYQQIISGLVSSYLKVGSMALMNGGAKSGSRYIDKANELVTKNLKVFDNIASLDSSMLEIIDLQNKISLRYSNLGFYSSAFFVNKLVSRICNNSSDSLGMISDSLRCILENEYLLNESNKISKYLGDYQYPDATAIYNIMNDSINDFNCSQSFIVKRDSIAEVLCDILYNESNILLKANQPVIALEKLLSAHSIRSEAGLPTSETVERISKAAEPVILDIVESAKFSTWKNDMEAAEFGLAKAIEYNKTFLSSSNVKVNMAISVLKTQIKQRSCVDIRNKYTDDIRTASLLVRDKKHLQIPDLINDAKNYLVEYPNCGLDSELLEQFVFRNSILLQYLSLYDSVRTSLMDRNYKKVIIYYHRLSDYYNSNQKQLNEVSYYPLDEFVKSQNIWALSLKVMEYYNSKGEPDISVEYLHMSMDQGFDPKMEKDLVMELAVNLAVRDSESEISARDAVRDYTRGRDGLGFFKMTYLKNRVMVPSR